jgi:hypothetical protein
MSQQLLYLGVQPGDRSGDSIRAGGAKINAMFTELYALQSRTINAAAFPGESREDQIQAAITEADNQNAERVFIPSFMLPYDATLVTFVPSVQMVREGGEDTYVDIRAYGATEGIIVDSSYAFAAARASGKPLYFPEGDWKGVVAVPNSTDRALIFGDGEYATSLYAPDAASPVLDLGNGSQHGTIKDLSVHCGAAGNNGTHYGIRGDNNPYLTIENVFAEGFNNNIHLTGINEQRLKHVRTSGAVYAAGITGCGVFASHPTAGTGFFVENGSSFEGGKYGIYCENLESPTIDAVVTVLQSDTGLYFTRSVAGSSVGPFMSNVQADSSSVQAIYLHKQIAFSISNTWVSGLGKGVVCSEVVSANLSLTCYNCLDRALTLSTNSIGNFITGVISDNAGGGVLINAGCHSNRVLIVARNNGAPGIEMLDTTAGFPNNCTGCIASDNVGGNIIAQTKDITDLAFPVTLAVAGSGAAGAATYNAQVAYFTRKPGGEITVVGTLDWTGHTGTGDLTITGLPFPASGAGSLYGMVEIAPYNLPYTKTQIYGIIPPGSTTISVMQRTGGEATAIAVPMAAAAAINFKATYLL